MEKFGVKTTSSSSSGPLADPEVMSDQSLVRDESPALSLASEMVPYDDSKFIPWPYHLFHKKKNGKFSCKEQRN